MTVTRRFAAGDRIVLDVPVRARITVPDPRIDAVRGTVAVERGPLVYALESLEAGTDVRDVLVPTGAEPVDHGADDVRLPVRSLAAPEPDGLPYGPGPVALPVDDPREVRLVPYATWGNRGPSTMRVFLPVG